MKSHPMPSGTTRRAVMLGTAAAAISSSVLGGLETARAAAVGRRLVAAPSRVPIAGTSYPETAVWAYGGTVPGPEIRVRQGDRLRVEIENRLPQSTTIHWHGVRVPNAMDGVPRLTQAPIEPGQRFVYEFDAVDAGTFWYHPHERSFEQVARGLYGALVIEERDSTIAVDRDVTWVLGDWRLRQDAEIVEDFGNHMDVGMAGRVGNTVTVNGRVADAFAVRGGERLRLRLINAASGRIFALDFRGHKPWIVALDGQPVEPHAPPGGRVVLGPATRVDVVLDCSGKPGARFQVVDDFYKRRAYRLLDLAYDDAPPLRTAPPETSIKLPPNPLAEPDLKTATRHNVEFGGGMMGMMAGGMTGGMMQMMTGRDVWSINGISGTGHLHEPFLTLRRNGSYVLAMHNNTFFHHSIHLHGHSFRVLSRDGRPTAHREWLDTVFMAANERVDIAFVADNPGDWMFHCHMLDHVAGGLMGVIRVA